MIKKLTISSFIITVILGVCALIITPFAVRNQLNILEKEYGHHIIYETVKDISVDGIKNVNITSHEGYKIFGSVYQTNDKEIKIYYRGFCFSDPIIAESRDGETLNLQIDLEHITPKKKDLINRVIDENGYLNFRIYIPKNLSVTLYTRNFTPRNCDITGGKEVLAANGKVYNKQNVPTSVEYYNDLAEEYSFKTSDLSYTPSSFEKLSFMMKDTFEAYDNSNIKRPLLLELKEKILNEMESRIRKFAEENRDICPDEFAIDTFVTCGRTYFNSQARLMLTIVEDNYFDDDVIGNYEEDSNYYSKELKTNIQDFFQAKDDFKNCMQTSIVSRKNDIINMLTFI